MFKKNAKFIPRKKKKGQSTVEYIILVAAIIGFLITFLPNTFQNAFNKAMQSGTNGMTDMANRLSSSRALPTNAD